jgi:hypothetical protein
VRFTIVMYVHMFTIIGSVDVFHLTANAA